LDHPVNLPILNIPELLRQHNLRPDKRLGQNFLVDDGVLTKIIQDADLQPQDSVLEIGAGLGNLTRYLAACARQVVAVEVDRRLLPILQQVMTAYPNVQIIAGDILSLDPGKLMLSGSAAPTIYRVIANIPYYITSAVIRHLLEAELKPQSLLLTVQHEVAERICAKPGDLSTLALSVQVYGQPRIRLRIPAEAFYPPPNVDSAVVSVDLFAQPAVPAASLKSFFRLIKAGFSQKRKTLRNALSGGLGWSVSQVEDLLASAGIAANRRAETVSLEEWILLTQSLESKYAF
jgi:16S rRNA (adenine1518-N6/adenine1519-N6)-dimethyltransferase